MRSLIKTFFVFVAFFTLCLVIIHIVGRSNWKKFIYFEDLIGENDAEILVLRKSLIGINDTAILKFSNKEKADIVWKNLNNYLIELNSMEISINACTAGQYSDHFRGFHECKHINFKNKNGFIVYRSCFVRSPINRELLFVKLTPCK